MPTVFEKPPEYPSAMPPVDVGDLRDLNRGRSAPRAQVEIVASFEEWAKAQTSSAEKHGAAEFSMSPWMQAAWRAWQTRRET